MLKSSRIRIKVRENFLSKRNNEIFMSRHYTVTIKREQTAH